MRLQIFIMLISSITIAFFISFIVCYILAKITSMPSRRDGIDEDKLAGAVFRAKVDNLKLTPKLSTFKVASKDSDIVTEPRTVVVKDLNNRQENDVEKNN